MKTRHLLITLLAVTLLVFTSGCEQEPARMDDFKVDFATVLRENSQLRFQFDNGQILTPINPEIYPSGANGQRVIINYTPLENNQLRIRAVSNIFTGDIRTEGFPELLRQDPVRIQSVWVGGEHLNLILEIQYHSIPHSVALFRDMDSPTIDLYFSYSRNSDPAGTSRLFHASFLLSSLRENGNEPVPFRFFINTHGGLREFEMILL